jgi:S-methylmethionine-dependent homocysteine/selenocysteine methylase
MGKELHRIGAPFGQPEWSALALLEDPASVVRAHRNFVEAGARVIIANAYAVVPYHIGADRFATRGRELAYRAGRLARQAADEAPHPVRVAASLPPLFGSYRPDRFDPGAAADLIGPLIEGQGPWVDLWIVETIGSCREAELALSAMERAGVDGERWLAFSLADQPGTGRPGAELDRPVLWSGETVTAAVELAAGTGPGRVDAVLINCAAPEMVTLALEEVVEARRSVAPSTVFGAYANGFPPRPAQYDANEAILGRRDDLTAVGYADHVRRWIDLGASIVGGCCGIHPEHIAELDRIIGDHPDRVPPPSAAPVAGA